ncbi:L-threonylcarbamoyladenylate synthase [Tianweitania sediminis]|uniref:Threonylcarbamoyl-AMP synthase n=1 Tax=Tianweitania sediminis TaxID=1502156 RepID=A0A8J7UJD6_9HYPH|nr:L-threonylcarbamoyladenylate synthase [Tianweitania sediminis]MBP0438765.1 threonylcarbamoyl-AMP synthase [Tianweitania sediminis]
MTGSVPADPLQRAVDALRRGGIVAVPTETVYGLAADATDGQAVARVFEAKGRPQFNPLIVHVADRAMADQIAAFDALSAALADRFWPGPLTLVLPLKEDTAIHPLVTAGLTTVALRMPQGPALEVMSKLQRPIAAPSANTSGRISPTSAQAVHDDLGTKLDFILDGGPTQVGLESTIVKVEGGTIRLLRPGGITAEEIEKAVGQTVTSAGARPAIEAPGMLASHYAPAAAVRLEAEALQPGEALLAFGNSRIAGADAALAVRNLSPSGDLREAAANLYAHLQALDRCGAGMIAVETIPHHGLGVAINDRLSRAAAPRGK